MKKRASSTGDGKQKPLAGHSKRESVKTKQGASVRNGTKGKTRRRKGVLPAAARSPRRFTKRWLDAIQLPAGLMMASSCSENVQVMEVSFGYDGGTAYQWPILDDFNGAVSFTAPQWTSWRSAASDSPRRWPVLYKRNTTPKIGALFYVDSFPIQPDYDNVYIRAHGSGGASDIPPTLVTADTIAHTVTLDPVLATAARANSVGYHPAFTLRWEICWLANDGPPSGWNWEPCCESVHQVYRCLADRVAGTKLFETVVHYACVTDGATTAAAAFADTWAHYVGKAIKGLNNATDRQRTRLLYYYKPGTGFAATAEYYETLLAAIGGTDTAACGAWARLFAEMIKTNGISNFSLVVISPPNYPGSILKVMLIKDWTLSSPMGEVKTQRGGASPPRYNDMEPFPPWTGSPTNNAPYGAYGDATNLPAPVANPEQVGQGGPEFPGGTYLNSPPYNSTNPYNPPSEKIHINHTVLLYPNANSWDPWSCYDASYGTVYSGTDMDDAKQSFNDNAMSAIGTNIHTFVDGGLNYTTWDLEASAPNKLVFTKI